MMANSLSSDLSDILAYYRSHPDLLRLILMSKVEEDKRRTEEAKLRQKELDLLLQQQQQALNQMLAEEEELGPPSPFYFYKPEPAVSTAAGTTSTMVVDKSCSLTEKHHPYHRANAPRRRREMQAITKIVETREFPYVDGYFWKNNGNTVQKRTGNKSIYYKCSNSSKGCAVNKTVTWKANGEYLIKYRGEHLLECGKVERIIEV
ncbi:hypothetical protein BX666DRAFT_2018633 [Dichotomocladium elegans]|nr:hypothetical protein BX666DRAFT_2018633 [Dichotomocladium elegans]